MFCVYDFVRGTLIPNMQVYDGENPNSIVIMDNCSIHHVQEVERDVIQQSGILPLLLPPHSPDLNPVEEAFIISVDINCNYIYNECIHEIVVRMRIRLHLPTSVGHLTRHIVSVMLCCVAINIDSNLLNNSW